MLLLMSLRHSKLIIVQAYLCFYFMNVHVNYDYDYDVENKLCLLLKKDDITFKSVMNL